MRALCLAFLSLLALPGYGAAEDPPVTIKDVRIGFRPNVPDNWGRFKPGLWAPVSVEVVGGPKGLPRCDLIIETNDCDAVQAEFTVPLQLQPLERRTVVTYVRPGDANPRVVVSVRSRGEILAQGQSNDLGLSAINLGDSLYVSLGGRLTDLQSAVTEMNGKHEDHTTELRQAGYEIDMRALPERWFGYDGVDLLVLTTDNKEFLDKLAEEPIRWEALGKWVKYGGRLLISVSPARRDQVRELLSKWQGSLARVLSHEAPVEHNRLLAIETLARLGVDKRFPASGAPPVSIVKFQADRDVEIIAAQDSDPLLVRLPYGRGSISLFALDLDKGPVAAWDGRTSLWKALLASCAPKSGLAPREQQLGRFGLAAETSVDLGSKLQRRLDEFDVPVVSFGWVAFFLFLSPPLFGPPDSFLLKKVFRRLYLTWITFPLVVLIVSLAAYFTARAVKGHDLKINKIDIVDIDQRSDLSENGPARQASAYGTTWWSLLSPHIQSYTLGLEPVVHEWLSQGKQSKADVMTAWMGRADSSGPSSFGRPRSQSMFRRGYAYAPDAGGLIGVSIPVWSSKSFTASWSAPLPSLVVDADLYYTPDNPEQLSGTVRSRLPFALEKPGILFGGKWFALEGPLKPGAKDPVQITRDPALIKGLEIWPDPLIQEEGERTGKVSFDATALVQRIGFHEAIDLEKHWMNHSYRRLDQSWRLNDRMRREYLSTREAILFDRLPRSAGDAEKVNSRADSPTRLWLGELPTSGQNRPPLTGNMINDTYVRIFLPVRARTIPRK
jgi:hypothetical protein